MNDAAASAGESLAAGALPAWTVAPFGLYLLLIAVIPLTAGAFWAKDRNKLVVAAILSAPVILYLALGTPHGLGWLADSIREYIAFMTLLLALYVITGGICLRGELAGTPSVNTAFLSIGAIAANLIGTTGASLLLIRPLLRANEKRQRRVHIVVFFIFIVANAGGLLTPLGDPPLFLGFLRGVPFFWGLRLLGPWALVNGTLLALFFIVDRTVLIREEQVRPAAHLEEVIRHGDEPLQVVGALNFVLASRRDRRGLRLGRLRTSHQPRSIPAQSVPGRRAPRDGGAFVQAHSAGGSSREPIRLGPPARSGGDLHRGLHDDGPRVARAGRAGERTRHHSTLAVLLGLGIAVELPRQRPDLPDVCERWRLPSPSS